MPLITFRSQDNLRCQPQPADLRKYKIILVNIIGVYFVVFFSHYTASFCILWPVLYLSDSARLLFKGWHKLFSGCHKQLKKLLCLSSVYLKLHVLLTLSHDKKCVSFIGYLSQKKHPKWHNHWSYRLTSCGSINQPWGEDLDSFRNMHFSLASYSIRLLTLSNIHISTLFWCNVWDIFPSISLRDVTYGSK